MDAKAYLSQLERLDTIILNKMVEKQQWFEAATKTTSTITGDRVQSSGSKEKMADAVSKVIDIEREINQYIDQLVDTKRDILKTIEVLPTEEYDVLHKLYVQRLTLAEVAEKKDKSYSWVTTTHKRALEKVQEILDRRK